MGTASFSCLCNNKTRWNYTAIFLESDVYTLEFVIFYTTPQYVLRCRESFRWRQHSWNFCFQFDLLPLRLVWTRVIAAFFWSACSQNDKVRKYADFVWLSLLSINRLISWFCYQRFDWNWCAERLGMCCWFLISKHWVFQLMWNGFPLLNYGNFSIVFKYSCVPFHASMNQTQLIRGSCVGAAGNVSLEYIASGCDPERLSGVRWI